MGKEENKKYGELSVGIDIGTTTVSVVVYDISNKNQIEALSVPHSSYICSDVRYEQNPSIIIEKTENMLYRILDSYEGVVSIGITGQMHGIIYVDKNGEAVSNLINWQDKRADQILESGKSSCDDIFLTTGENVPTGYGIATHYCNLKLDIVPRTAAHFCSIMDLFAMKICGTKKILTHTSVASSFGLFDVKNGKFKEEKLSILGIDLSFLPSVTGKSAIIGECRGIPVSVPIGDNQASFIGSVPHNNSVLVNIGTGSQVCAVTDYRDFCGDIELRPLIEGEYLACGSALCGGYAYNMLESFFRSYTVSAGMQDARQYEIMNKLAIDAYERGNSCPEVDVSFLGKRSAPSAKGSINGIDSKNFTPSALILGVLKGMCNELYELYRALGERKSHLIASGGAIEKIKVLKNLISDRFEMSVTVSESKEEAAMGAALFSALAIGKIGYDSGFGKYIR